MTQEAVAAVVPTLSRRLASFATALPFESLPAEVVHCARRAFVDWMAALLAGVGEPPALKVRQTIAEIEPDGPVNMAGTARRASAPFAALANAYASHLLDYDDVYNPPETTIHLGSCVWPVVMSLGAWKGIDGPAAVAAYIAGFETGARVARAAGPRHYQSGWHVTGTAGHIAAVAAACRILQLSPVQATHAFGCAATQAAGVRSVYGSDTKAIHPAKAAMDGVLSALLAEHGFTSTDDAIEGPRGLLQAITPEARPERMVEGLGDTWLVLDNGHKLYPSASLTHAPIEAAFDALDGRPAPADIDQVTLRMHPFAASVTALVHPQSAGSARFSVAHCVAVALHRGLVKPADFSTEALSDPAIAALRDAVRIVADDSVDKRGCTIDVHTRHGEVLHGQVQRNRGTADAPLEDAELDAKLSEVLARHGGAARAVVDACWSIDEAGSLDGLLAQIASLGAG